MRVAFAIFKSFPHGGVARDLRNIAAECLARGHAVRIYAMIWQGVPLAGAEIVTLPTRGLRGHVRQRRFAAAVRRQLRARPVDLVVGMNKMPGIDVYYAGDSCFVAKARAQRPWAYRLTARYRHFAAFERAVFAAEGRTRILAISPPETAVYASTHHTPAHRFHPLPPGLGRDRARAGKAAAAAVRRELGAGDERLLLFVGSGFVKKGLDRALRGLAALPDGLRARTRLCIAGADRAARFRRLARRLGIGQQVRFLGGRDDVPALLRAADGLVLPAYDENTGTVILESAAAGLPALVTANCGYASYVAEHNTGIVAAAPFDQARFNADLERLLTSTERRTWAENGRALGRDERLYAMPSAAVDLLEGFAGASQRPVVALCVYEYLPTAPNCRPLAAIAAACQQRGMDARVYACEFAEALPPGIPAVRLRVAAWSAAGRLARYQRRLAARLARHGARCVIGFHEALRGVDMRCGPALEVACRPARCCGAATRAPLPPGVAPAPPRPRERSQPADTVVFAMIGGDLAAHGVDRLFAAFGKLPARARARCRVLAAGRLAAKHLAAARAFDMGDRVAIRGDAKAHDILGAADVFVDLAFRACANGWVFDAMAAGLVVLTHAEVAEARLVRDADAGLVLPTPFRQAECDRALAHIVEAPASRRDWRANAVRFALRPERYGQAAHVADRIGAWLDQRSGNADASLPA